MTRRTKVKMVLRCDVIRKFLSWTDSRFLRRSLSGPTGPTDRSIDSTGRGSWPAMLSAGGPDPSPLGFRPYQTGVRGTVEIESDWMARQRGWELPEWMRDPRAVSSTSPAPSTGRNSASPVPKGEGPGHPRVDENPLPRLDEIPLEIRASRRGSGDPRYSRSGDRRYKFRSGDRRYKFSAVQVFGACEKCGLSQRVHRSASELSGQEGRALF